MLQEQQDGMTAAEIATVLDANPSAVISALRRMPDCYIDRWQQSGKSKYASVWCAVTPPSHCPHPKKP